MIAGIIMLLIYICLVVLVAWLVIWVLGQLGIALPEMVVKILWVIVILIIVLMLVEFLTGMGGASLHFPRLAATIFRLF